MRHLLLTFAGVLCAVAPLAPAQRPAARPNVLLVAIDDLNDWVGALGGHPQAATPHIDRLARRGTLFTNAHCQAPLCAASRASFATGRLPSTTGMYFLEPSLAAEPTLRDVETLTERFGRAGYRTLGAGKIHHGDERRFFDDYGGSFGGLGPRPEAKLSYPQGHPLWDWGAFPDDDGEMPDVRIADWAAARLAEDHDQPFFLAVGFYRPHVPMYAPRRWFDRHPLDAVQLPAVLDDDRDDLAEYARLLTEGLPAPRHDWFVQHDQWRHAVQAYLACSTFVDHCVGRVLEALESSAHRDDTIVVLFSDHGFHLGEKQRWAKRSLWEDATRVPLIVFAPGFAPSATDRPAGLIDIYPTLLDLCGLDGAEDPDGASLVPLMRDPTGARERPALTTFGPGNHAVRSTHWRYIRYADGSEELYDHRTDPHEWDNLAASPEHAEVIRQHRRHLPPTDHETLPGAERSSGHRAWLAAEATRR